MRDLRHPVRRRHDQKPRRFALLIGMTCAAWLGAARAQTPAAQPGPEEPVALDRVRAGPASPVSAAAAPAQDMLPDLTAITSWSIPPVRWGGNTTSNYSWNDASGNKSYSETQTVNLRGSSYIYQPWYAQVSGDVGLLMGKARQDGTVLNPNATNSRSSAMTYGGNLNLFPQSRFPFQAYLQKSDSRASANAVSSQYTTTRFGASQSWRPETGPQNFSANADRSIVEGSGVRSVVDAFSSSFGTTLGEHNVSANARYSRNSGDLAGQGSNLLTLGGTHSWHLEEELTIASSVNYTNNQIRMLNGNNGLASNSSQLVQAGSSFTWLPDEDLPLTIVGGGSFLNMNTETEAARANLTYLNGYANANYRFSNNLSGTAGLTLAQSQSNGVRQLSAGQNASVSYSGNPLTFGDYSYNWGLGGSVSNQIITGGASNRTVSGLAQHSVLRSIVLGEGNAISLNASESLSLAFGSGGQSTVLTHSGGASWRRGIGERSVGTLSASVSDSYSRGAFASHYRSLTTQGNTQTQLTARSVVTANVNFVVSQQLSQPQAAPMHDPITGAPSLPAATDDGSRTMNGSGQVRYMHRSPFGIADLTYTASLQTSAAQTNLRLVSGDPNALGWQTGRVFQQNVDYRLGRLIFRTTNSFAALNGKKNASLFFMIGRDIGDF
jgi:hypothetical protein